MNVIEKYTRSVNSSNLKDDEFHHGTDVLAAVALSSDVGSLFYRVKYANDATSYAALLGKWRDIVTKKAALRTWPSHISAAKVAEISLKHWLNDLCEPCGGRGVEAYRSGKQISDIACKVCGGSAKKGVVCDHRERDYIEDMVSELDGYAFHAAGVAMRKLRQQMDF